MSLIIALLYENKVIIKDTHNKNLYNINRPGITLLFPACK